MPADIIGTNVIDQGQDGLPDFRFERGPVFANIVLADEITVPRPRRNPPCWRAIQEQGVWAARPTLQQPFGVALRIRWRWRNLPLPEAQLTVSVKTGCGLPQP